jgi:NitT/TauT family transport system substrate-binding protein
MPELFNFKIGEASPANTFFAIWMAKDAGIYESYGLKPEIVKVIGGKDAGSDLASGKIHLMHIGMSSVVRANAVGSDIVTVGSLSNIIRNTMFTAPGIKTAADLKGKKIGISSAGSETDPTTTLALRRLGLSRDDVTIVEIGTVRLHAVSTGEVAASLMGEPTRSQALALGLNAIVDLYADHTPWLYSGLVVHRNFLKTNRNQVLAFIRGTVEGNYLAVSDEMRAKKVLARELGLTDQKFIDISHANFKAETPMNAEMTLEGAKNIIEIVAPRDTNRDPAAYMDESIHRELEAEGFFKTMRTKYAVA